MRVPASKRRRITEFGDFQTPAALAREVCGVLARHLTSPSSILEPTCGTGGLLLAALEGFPSARRALGLEINPDYVGPLARSLRQSGQPTASQAIQR